MIVIVMDDGYDDSDGSYGDDIDDIYSDYDVLTFYITKMMIILTIYLLILIYSLIIEMSVKVIYYININVFENYFVIIL